METFEVDDDFVSENGQFDLTLILDKHKIHVTKAVLFIASPVFRAMIRSDFKEKEQNEIQLPGKDYDDVVRFLNCIYPDRMENVTSDTVYRVLPLAHEYQVNALMKKCHEFLLQLVKSKYLTDATEICRHIQISEKYNLSDLYQKSVSIASEFSLEKFERAAEKYPITVDSLIKVHRQARMREELNKNDDRSVLLYHVSDSNIKSFVENQLCSYSRNTKKALQALRMCYRYFPDDLQLFENVIKAYKNPDEDEIIRFDFGDEIPSLPVEDTFESDVEELISLLPEMVKQKIDLK